MGTSVNALAEQYGDRRATWYFSSSLSDTYITGSTFTVPVPTMYCKYVYAGKNFAEVLSFNAQPSLAGRLTEYSAEYSIGGGMWANDTYLSLTYRSSNIPTQNTSTYFTSSNKTTRTITLQYNCSNVWAESRKYSSGAYQADWDGFLQYGSISNLVMANVTLNVPPTIGTATGSYASPQYAGLGEYTATLSTIKAYYGGDVQTVTLKIGKDSTTHNFSSATVSSDTISVTPSVAGTYTPTITVTDTRGQSKTVNLEQITVNAYTAPSISFDLQRTNGSGIPNVEGEHGLVAASISYTDAIAELTQPTVVVRDENGNLVVSSATWYETLDATNGVDDAVNWTDYNPQSPVILYAVVSATGSMLSPNESYTVSITPTDNQGGVAQTITQTLSTGFFTIDFKAGGKEIAFGAPANDTLTQTQETKGLFKCNMEAAFRDKNDVIRMLFDFVYPVGSYYETSDVNFDPNATWGGTWILETAGMVHVSGATSGTYTVSGANSADGAGAKDGGSKDAVVIYHTHKVSSGWQSASGQPDRITYGTVNGGYNNTGYGNVQFLEGVGVAGTDKNMPPYIVVYRWHRTA